VGRLWVHQFKHDTAKALLHGSAVLVFDVFVQVLLPILLMFGAGWLMDRRWNLDLSTVVKLNINCFVPAFIFHELVTKEVGGGMAWKTVGFTISVIAVLFLLAAVVGRGLGYPPERVRSLQMAAGFYNSANYGIPLMHLAFPGEAEALQAFVVLVQNAANFTVGIFMVSSSKTPGWRAVLPVFRQVSLWAVVSALLIRTLYGPVSPDLSGGMRWLWVPIKYFHDGLVAVALMTLGIQLSKVRTQFAFSRIGWALGLRLLGGPLVAWGVGQAFGFERAIFLSMILSASFPTAVNTAMLAHEFGTDAEFATETVFWSTILSMVSVTLLVVLLRG
jgi:predicted permease